MAHRIRLHHQAFPCHSGPTTCARAADQRNPSPTVQKDRPPLDC